MVVSGDQIEAWLGRPLGLRNFTTERYDAPGNLAVRHERSERIEDV
jgi:hypothetical protein